MTMHTFEVIESPKANTVRVTLSLDLQVQGGNGAVVVGKDWLAQEQETISQGVTDHLFKEGILLSGDDFTLNLVSSACTLQGIDARLTSTALEALINAECEKAVEAIEARLEAKEISLFKATQMMQGLAANVAKEVRQGKGSFTFTGVYLEEALAKAEVA